MLEVGVESKSVRRADVSVSRTYYQSAADQQAGRCTIRRHHYDQAKPAEENVDVDIDNLILRGGETTLLSYIV
jgi:hypothetical protein